MVKTRDGLAANAFPGSRRRGALLITNQISSPGSSISLRLFAAGGDSGADRFQRLLRGAVLGRFDPAPLSGAHQPPADMDLDVEHPAVGGAVLCDLTILGKVAVAPLHQLLEARFVVEV